MKDKDLIQFTRSEKYKDNVVLRLSFEFAITIIEYSETLEEKRKYVIAKQIIRSGTSIGANIKEAQNAESKADFIHKIKIALKEADETEYWLFLCNSIGSYPNCDELIEKIQPILKLLNKIIGTSKNNLKK
jgi:four helix bundle protein